MSGIMPDYMHIVHLALAVDAIALIDVVDIDGLVAGATRDLRLGSLWLNYHAWAEATSCFAYNFFGVWTGLFNKKFELKTIEHML